MPTRDYTVNYIVDTSQAMPGFRAVWRALNELNKEAGQVTSSATAAGAALGQMGTQAHIASVALGNTHTQTTKASQGFFGLNAEMVGTAAAFKAIEVGIDIVRDVGEQINKAREKTKEFAEEVMQLRGEMRELANLKGHDGPDDEVTFGAIEFGMKAGMDGKQAARFLEQFYGSVPAGLQKGNIGDGKRKGESQDQYEKRIQPIAEEIAAEGARFGQRVHLDYKTSGDMTGVLAQYGKVPNAQDAAGKMGKIAFGLNEGRGNLEPLMRSLINTAGAVVDENEGPVGSIEELAVMLGVASTHHNPREAGTYLKKGIRELRQFTGPQGQSLEEMGITPKDTPLQAIGKLKTRLETEKKVNGLPADVAMRNMGFGDEAGMQALIEQVHDLDMTQGRLKKMEDITGKSVQTKNDKFFKTDRAGIKMDLDARSKAATFLKGRENEAINIARVAAVTRLRDAGALNGPEMAISDKIQDAGGIYPTLGVPKAFEQRIDAEALKGLYREAQNVGAAGPIDKAMLDPNRKSQTGGSKTLRFAAQAINVATAGLTQPFEGPASQILKPHEIDAMLEDIAADPTLAASLFEQTFNQVAARGGDPTGGTGGVRAKVHDKARPEEDKEKKADFNKMRTKDALPQTGSTPELDEREKRNKQRLEYEKKQGTYDALSQERFDKEQAAIKADREKLTTGLATDPTIPLMDVPDGVVPENVETFDDEAGAGGGWGDKETFNQNNGGGGNWGPQSQDFTQGAGTEGSWDPAGDTFDPDAGGGGDWGANGHASNVRVNMPGDRDPRNDRKPLRGTNAENAESGLAQTSGGDNGAMTQILNAMLGELRKQTGKMDSMGGDDTFAMPDGGDPVGPMRS